MFRKPLLSILVLLPLLAVFLFPLSQEPTFSPFPQSLVEGRFAAELEQTISDRLPHTFLEKLGLNVRLFSGQREQNGIFISENALMKNIDPPNAVYIEENTDAIIDFAIRARSSNCSVFFALIPTSGAILQENLPRFAPSQMVNQRQIIENVYSQLAGVTSTIDIYSTLFGRREEYIYYRTENNLTALGGYYVYTALGNRLDKTGSGSYPLHAFDIEYVSKSFYGDLYAASPYKNVRADILSLFTYNRQNLAYTITQRQGDNVRTYHTLYPKHMLDLNRPTDIYLGGLSAVTDIQTLYPSGNNTRSLLVLGDKTALAYLPFLTNQYQRITFIDLFQNPEDYKKIDLDPYKQILFAYSTETYMHWNTPSRASLLEF